MKKFYRINQFIQAPEVRLIGLDNKQIGILPIRTALDKAAEAGQDLVEITNKINPPICRIIDFKKFKYQEAKKERQNKKGIKKIEVKQIYFTPYTGKNDYQIGVNKSRRWLEEGNKVKSIVKFVGRQVTKKEFGYALLNNFIKDLEEISQVEQAPKFERQNIMSCILVAGGKKKK